MASIYQRGKSWVLQWREGGRGSRQHRRNLGPVTEAEAQAQLAAHRQRLVGGPPAAGPTFSAWCETYATWHSQEYPDSYFRVEQILRTHLIPAFGPLPLLGITREVVEAYKQARIRAQAAPGTVQKELRTLQAAMNRAVFLGVIPRNPAAGVKPPRDLASAPPRWYSREELAAIYRVELEVPKCTTADDAELHRAYRWSWQLMVNTGLRRGEALALHRGNIGQEEIRVISTEEARTKSGRWRLVPLSAGAREALESLPKKGYVLPRVRPESLSRAFDRTTERAGLGGSIHCLRHTYCSHLVMQGVPLRTVQQLAGHASYRTTERYAHLAPGHLQDAVRGLDL
jgi:integrase